MQTQADRVEIGAISMEWDPDARLAAIRFETETHATGEHAAVLVDALRRWIGTDARLFGLLGDGGKLASVNAEYRFIWGAFFRQHRVDSRIAFFNMGPVIRIAADMFRIGTGLRLKAFRDESAARAWLRRMGIAA